MSTKISFFLKIHYWFLFLDSHLYAEELTIIPLKKPILE